LAAQAPDCSGWLASALRHSLALAGDHSDQHLLSQILENFDGFGIVYVFFDLFVDLFHKELYSLMLGDRVLRVHRSASLFLLPMGKAMPQLTADYLSTNFRKI